MDPKLLDELDSFNSLSQETEIILLGVPLLHINYGMCHSHRVILKKSEEIVYLWDKSIETETREEFFFGEQTPSRKYIENKFCFLEYCWIAYEKSRIPNSDDLVNSDLTQDMAEKYQNALERIVNETQDA